MVLIVVLVCAWLYFGYSPVPEEPTLSALPAVFDLVLDGQQRSAVDYIPAQLPDHAPLLIVLHGAVMNGAQMRIATGYEFDELADQRGFAVVYPNGYKGHWYDCRTRTRFPARRENVDDISFITALIQYEVTEHHIDPQRVFVTGFSNGGHMAFKLRAEAPHLIAGIAVTAASLVVTEDSDCAPQRAASPVLMMNGTDDLLNAYDGGEKIIFGIAKRGRVMPTPKVADLFAKLNGVDQQSVVETLTNVDATDDTRVTKKSWRQVGRPPVVLYSINGGGHVIPQPHYRFPRMYGLTSRDVDFPRIVVDFFGL